jgi:hypothetical protein
MGGASIVHGAGWLTLVNTASPPCSTHADVGPASPAHQPCAPHASQQLPGCTGASLPPCFKWRAGTEHFLPALPVLPAECAHCTLLHWSMHAGDYSLAAAGSIYGTHSALPRARADCSSTTATSCCQWWLMPALRGCAWPLTGYCHCILLAQVHAVVVHQRTPVCCRAACCTLWLVPCRAQRPMVVCPVAAQAATAGSAASCGGTRVASQTVLESIFKRHSLPRTTAVAPR